MGFGERFFGMFSAERKETAKSEVEKMKKEVQENAAKIEAQGKTKSFLNTLRESTATKFVALATLLVFSERVANAQPVSPEFSQSSQQSVERGGMSQESKGPKGEEKMDVQEIKGDQTVLQEQDSRSYARHYDADGRINIESITGGIVEQVQQATNAELAKQNMQGIGNAGDVYERAQVGVTFYASAEGDTTMNEKLAADSAAIAENQKRLMTQDIAEQLGMDPDQVQVNFFSGGEHIPLNENGIEFKDKAEFMSYMAHELGMNADQLKHAIDTYNGLHGVDAQKKQAPYMKKFFDKNLRDQRNPVYTIELTPKTQEVLVGQSVPIDVDNRIPPEMRGVEYKNGRFNEPFLAREEDEPLVAREKTEDETSPKPQKPKPGTQPLPPVRETTPEPYTEPAPVVEQMPEITQPEPGTEPKLQPVIERPEPKSPVVEPPKPKPQPQPKPRPVLPGPKPPEPRPEPVVIEPPTPGPEPKPKPTPEPIPVIVEPPEPLPPSPEPEPIPVVEQQRMQGQGSREIQAMKRQRAESDTDEENIGIALRKNTGRGSVETDADNDAQWIGSRQSGARLRARGTGSGDRGTAAKERSKDRGAARQAKNTRTGNV